MSLIKTFTFKTFRLNKSTLVILFLIFTAFLNVCATELEVFYTDDFIYNFGSRLHKRSCTQRLPKKVTVESVKPSDLIDVYFKGEQNEVVHIIVYDPDHRLMNDKIFTPSRLAPKGTRKVGFYGGGDENEFPFCLKQYPEAPGLEIARNLLLQRIVAAVRDPYKKDLKGMQLPCTMVIIMNGSVFSGSKYISGDNLDDILRDPKRIDEIEGGFNPVELMVGIVDSFFTTPEDLRWQNVIFYTSGRGKKCHIMGIDAERTFGPAYQVRNCAGIVQTVRAHSVFFALPHMHYAAPKDSFRLRRKALEQWVEYVELENGYQTKLQQHATSDEFTLGVSITPGILSRVYQTREIVNKGISGGATFMQMLGQISPALFKVYAPTIKGIGSGEMFMHMLGQISPSLAKLYDTTTIRYLRFVSINNTYTTDEEDDYDGEYDDGSGCVASKNFLTTPPNDAKQTLLAMLISTLMVDGGR